MWVGLQRVATDAGRRRHALTDLVGPAAGDRVVLNTTAADLGLGTGGWHVVHWNLARDAWERPGPGHIMKLRYTSLQHDAGAAEEDHPDLPSAVPGLPVGVLAAQPGGRGGRRGAAPAARRPHRVRDDRRGGPAPGAVRRGAMRWRGVLDATITAGHAFGGDMEVVGVPSALAPFATWRAPTW